MSTVPAEREYNLPTGLSTRAAAPAILAIGASTGGPQALVSLVAGFASHIRHLPVCVTLHMPRDLMPVVAAHVARRCAVETRVVCEPSALVPGIVYFAPGDRHLVLARCATGHLLDLVPSPSRDFCQPAVDVMFASIAKVYGPRVLAVVLSGMGKDGLVGAGAITAAGGTVLVQDQASSAVWGMPGSVAKAGLARATLPPPKLALEIVRRIERLAATR